MDKNKFKFDFIVHGDGASALEKELISNGSTGNIMMSIHNQLLKDNVDSYVIWGRGRDANNKNEIRIKKN